MKQAAQDALSLLWLIRKRSGHLIGPLAGAQVREMIEQGLLDSEDELCPENSYWFSVDEVEEVRRRLGMQDVFVRSAAPFDQEPTLTSETITDVPSSSGAPPTPSLSQARVAALQAKAVPTPAQLAVQFRRPPSAIIGLQTGTQAPDQAPYLEKSKLWSFLIFLASVLVGTGIIWIFRLLRSPKF